MLFRADDRNQIAENSKDRVVLRRHLDAPFRAGLGKRYYWLSCAILQIDHSLELYLNRIALFVDGLAALVSFGAFERYGSTAD